MKFNRGISVLELMISISVTAIIFTVGVSVFNSLSNRESLDRDVSVVASAFEKARTQSINGIGNTEHGVKLSSSTVTLFYGTSFTSGSSSSSIFYLSPKSEIYNVSLSNASTSLFFNKISGKPSATGTIIVKLSNGLEQKTIQIFASGILDGY